MEALPEDREDRGVESYDFTRARFDPRPQVQPIQIEGIPKELEKIRREEERARARRVKERLGVREDPRETPPTAPTDDVVDTICKRLNEPKIGLIERVVHIVGKDKALQLLTDTENIEANGGLLINNGSRRRTPGGVYLHLLRSDPQISGDDLANIFAPDRAECRDEQRKRKRTEVEKKAYRTIRRLEQAILGEASSSSMSSDGDDQVEMKRTRPMAMDEDAVAATADADWRSGSHSKVERTSDLEEGEIDD